MLCFLSQKLLEPVAAAFQNTLQPSGIIHNGHRATVTTSSQTPRDGPKAMKAQHQRGCITRIQFGCHAGPDLVHTKNMTAPKDALVAMDAKTTTV
jgi:hypothetical protein